MNTLLNILAAAEGDPDLFTRYLVAADAAEEGGDEEVAAGLRWMAREKKAPKPDERDGSPI